VIFYSDLFYLLIVDVEVYFCTWSHTMTQTHTHTHTHTMTHTHTCTHNDTHTHTFTYNDTHARTLGQTPCMRDWQSQRSLPNKTQIFQENNNHVPSGV